MITALILARAGSKRLPMKNLAKLGNHSLLGWAVLSAKACSSITRIVVSTDGEMIAEEALRYGAEAVMRPESLARDDTTSADSAIHAVVTLNLTQDTIVLLQPTSPLRSGEDIDNTLDLLKRSGAPAVITVGPDGAPNGAVYAIRAEALLSERTFAPAGYRKLEMPASRSIDIDVSEDLERARALSGNLPNSAKA